MSGSPDSNLSYLLTLGYAAACFRLAERIELNVNISRDADGDIVIRAVDDVIGCTTPVTVFSIPSAITLELDDTGLGEGSITFPAKFVEVVGHLDTFVPVVIHCTANNEYTLDGCKLVSHIG